jgi:hypothetical protein
MGGLGFDSSGDAPRARALTAVAPVEHAVTVAAPVDRALETVADAAEIWGGEWQRHGTGGRLAIPLAAGIRRGFVAGAISTEPAAGGVRLRFLVETSEFRVQRSALFILLVGAAGGVLLMVAPLVPGLLELLPVAVVVLLLAWFLVLSRLRNRSADDFLREVAELAQVEDEATEEAGA